MVDPGRHPEFALSSAETVSILSKYSDWLQPRGGGVTVSGGEPMLQPDFVADLFQRAHEIGLTTCLDTACFGNVRRWDKLLKHTDNVLLCLKAMDNDLAARVAQVPASEMSKSKEFARHIRDFYPHIRITLRWVLLQGLTDTSTELNSLIDFSKELGDVFHEVELIPYHELGREKYDLLSMKYPLKGITHYDMDDALRVRDALRDEGIPTVLSSYL